MHKLFTNSLSGYVTDLFFDKYEQVMFSNTLLHLST